MSVQLTNRLGAPLQERGVSITLAQVVYSETALQYGEASINGMPEGQTPVIAHTDAAGVAHFVVRGIQAESDPVFFQTWVLNGTAAPSSYSNMVSVQFVRR